MIRFGIVKRSSKPFVGVVIVGIVATVIFVLIYSIFTIQTIEVVGGGVHITVDEKRFPKHLLFIGEKKLTDELLRRYPQLESITIQKRYPHTLVVIAKPRVGIARLHTAIGSFRVDADGVVLEDTDVRETLPLLDIPVLQLSLGEHIKENRVLSAIGFVGNSKAFVTIVTIQVADGASLLAKSATTDIFFPQHGNSVALAATLQTLMRGFRMKGVLPAKIDLRFDKPVVSF